jgi:hypothetical protein
MSNFIEFSEWLFPGDEIDTRLSNPLDAPEEVIELLQEVNCRTGIPISWLEKTVALVLDGLAGAQCLWFLHGAAGEIESEIQVPQWARISGYNALLGTWIKTYIETPAKEKDKTLDKIVIEDIDWGGGKITMTRYFIHPKKPKTQTQKLGKILNKIAKSSRSLKNFSPYIKEFETRELPHWEWRISAHPLDVLTMSFRRPWTSCMRPPDPEKGDPEGGEAQYGPLTDMAAGSAVMFFYRPGANVPCGRLILRPALDYQNDPMIYSGKRIYGCGPNNIDPEQIERMLEDSTGVEITVGEYNLCVSGDNKKALSRKIYDDNANQFCSQTTEEYDEAYEALVEANWPDPQVDSEEIYSVAAEFKEEFEDYEYEESEEDREERLQRLIDEATPSIATRILGAMTDEEVANGITIVQYSGPYGDKEYIGQALNPLINTYFEDEDEFGGEEATIMLSEYILDDLYTAIGDYLEERLNKHIKTTTYSYLFALSVDHSGEYSYINVKPPEEAPSWFLKKLNVEYNKEEDEYTKDAEIVESIAIAPDFIEALSGEWPDDIIGYVEESNPGQIDWTWLLDN